MAATKMKASAYKITWAKGWGPKRLARILEFSPNRVGFKAPSAYVSKRRIIPGNIIRRRSDLPPFSKDVPVEACSHTAVHLAWNPYHKMQNLVGDTLGVGVMLDRRPGATGDGDHRKAYGTAYVIVATIKGPRNLWWTLATRSETLQALMPNITFKPGRYVPTPYKGKK
jgi:hypothetical protein